MKIFSKIIILLLFVIASKSLVAQELTYNDVKNGKFDTKVKYTTYVSRDGTIFKSGNKLKFGMPSRPGEVNYTFIKDLNFSTLNPVNATRYNTELEIEYFFLFNYSPIAEYSSKNYFVVARSGKKKLRYYIVYMEQALDSKEIFSTGMTSDEALSELKKAKDKLDLGLITQEKYDSLKKEYSKIIK